MKSIGRKLFVAIALPTFVVVLIGVSLLWLQTDRAVREQASQQALGLAEFIASSFSDVDQGTQESTPRLAHRSVTSLVRGSWGALSLASGIRVIDNDGIVRWSKEIEEEDQRLVDSARLLQTRREQATFAGPSWLWPWGKGGGGEVLYPLGGVSCAECHPSGPVMQRGVLQVTVGESALRAQVQEVFTSALKAVVGFAAILAAAVALSLRLLLTQKLKRLAHAMRRAEEGDLIVRAPDLGRDEIGSLAQSFNRMLERLTEFKVSEIDTQRDLDRARHELALKTEVETLNAKLGARVGELEVLFEIVRTIASTLELSEVLSRITTILPTRLNVDRFSVMLLNQEGHLEVLQAFPANEGSEGVLFSLGEGICGYAAVEQRSVYVADLELEPRFKVLNHSAHTSQGSLLSIPMLRGSELLGVLNFERRQKAAFDRQEIDFFGAIADQASIAVHNARLYQQTVALSVTDPLTGVHNRRHLFQQLEAEVHRGLRYQTPVSVVMIDIDHFKHLNDAAGHQAGDEALREVCRALKANLRKVDTLARYGGEEFIVLLPQVARKEAFEVAEKLRVAVEQSSFEAGRFQPGGKLTISLGVATLPSDAGEQLQLIDAADAALYASKRTGRNRVTAFEAGMDLHPGRQRGPHAVRRRTGETPVVKV